MRIVFSRRKTNHSILIHFFPLLLIVLCFLFVCSSAIAITVVQGQLTSNITWIISSESESSNSYHLSITGTGAMPDWTSVSGEGAPPWTEYRDDITSVEIGNGITTIGNNSFYLCSALTTISLPETLTSIGDNAFKNTAITSIVIPEAVSTIGWDAFENCRSLSTIILPSEMVSIERFAFQGCSSLEEITIPYGIKTLGAFIFDGCSSLGTVSLPTTLETIEDYAFSGCSSLITVTIPAKVNSILLKSFGYCYSLENIEVASGSNNYCSVNGVLFTKDMKTLVAYPANKADTSYTVPTTVECISSYAFSGARNIKNVILPEGLQTIGYYGFGDSTIESVNFPSTLTDLGKQTFTNCMQMWNADLVIPGSVKTVDEGAFSCAALHSVVLEEGVKVIKSGSFYLNNAGNTTITIPASVKTIEAGAISNAIRINCHRNSSAALFAQAQGNPVSYICDITTIVHPATSSEDGYIYTGCEVCNYSEGEEVILHHNRTITIPENVRTIETEAFTGISAEQIVLSDSLEQIDEFAFSGCSNLFLVVVRNSETRIDKDAFMNCPYIRILCPKDSYAEVYAQEFSIPYSCFNN